MAYYSNRDYGHSAGMIALVVLNALIYAVTLMFNFLSSSQVAVGVLFETSVGNRSRKYPTKITPTSEVFSIWYLIYVWQIVSLIYTLTLLCRKNKDGCFLYMAPRHVPVGFYLSYSLANAFVTCWLFVWDRQQLELSFVFLLLTTIALYISGVFLCRALSAAGSELERLDHSADIWLTRFLILNAVAVYGGWCTVASWINFSTVLIYVAGVDAATCAWISLSVVAVKVVIWAVLEFFIFDKHLRYCFSQYIPLIVGFSGITAKFFNPTANPESYTYFVVVLLAVVSMLALTKLVVMIVKSGTSPIRYIRYHQPTILQGKLNQAATEQ